ncbi:hypothetical protein RirG_148680 [Rhizophagus irregularis DAOM 197198w]|uniref:Uncharacterized protein n=1 Tax=Rhizophagus irregularis (strain DAOM 197198w) TaxID=1432141 RepID=A0A015K8L0_RHIIW|nr:hypothetical protein RirG_148680 [Rhizophagus irregularis DAOM 197198w]
MGGWKYSKQRLQKHPFVAKVIRAKKESEVEDVIDDDDIITVDENEVEINNGEENANIEIISSAITNKTGRKRKPCLGLCSDLIAKYVDSRALNRLG